MIKESYHIIIGTKAQLVKMAPVMLALDKYQVNYQFVLTGQHQETMSDLISSFSLKKPDTVLYTKHESDSPVKLLKWFFSSSISAWRLREDFKKSRGFVVHGDTLSTLWGALFSHLFAVKCIHVEAGLRSFNYLNPFPEELIRVVVTKLSKILFAGGLWAKNNINESNDKSIIDTNFNTILDSLKFAIEVNTQALRSLDSDKEAFIVVSIHRTENILSNKNFNKIMSLIVSSSKKTKIKMVLHPITRKRLKDTHWFDRLERCGIELIPRMNYVNFMQLLYRSSGLITDGGSNQEEASFLGLPCLLMRKHTERTDGLDSNIILSKLDSHVIENFLSQTINTPWQKKDFPDFSPSEIIAKTLRAL